MPSVGDQTIEAALHPCFGPSLVADYGSVICAADDVEANKIMTV